MSEYDVLIAGAGPTGLMLAGELALAGVDVAVIERRAQHDLAGSRAGGMTSRTLEVLDQRGIVDRFLTQGWTGQIGHYAGISLPIGDLPTRHNYGLGLPQYRIERTLAGWARELGAKLLLGREVTGFTQDDGGVDCRTVRRCNAAHAVPHRLRWWAQHHPQDRRHRLPGMGPLNQLPARRRRNRRRTAMGHAPHWRVSLLLQVGGPRAGAGHGC